MRGWADQWVQREEETLAAELDSLTSIGSEGKLASGEWLRTSSHLTGAMNFSLLQDAPEAQHIAPWAMASEDPECFVCCWKQGLVRCHYCHALRCSWHRKQYNPALDAEGHASGGGIAWCFGRGCNDRAKRVLELYQTVTRAQS